jgi:hypothetical protein
MVETDIKWCTWSVWTKNFPEHIGQLLEQHGNSGTILYSERQMYPPELWDMNYVEVFDTAEEAIIFMLKKNNDACLYRIREYWNFHSTIVDCDRLKKIEIEIDNKRRNGIKV